MPEILTESFCERCGTRYTFESAAPRVARLKGVKVLSRGLKNFVMSDDTSMDEAMAAARSDTDRELTSQQLDAFHKTFNFCMSCRQYTCGNCWNDAEGRCLSCAPHLGHEIMPAPFPDLDPAAALAGNGSNWTNGHAPEEPAAALAWPAMDLDRDGDEAVDLAGEDLSDLEPVDAAARLAALGATDDPEPPAAAIDDHADQDDGVALAEAAAEADAVDEADVAQVEPLPAADLPEVREPLQVAEAQADEPADAELDVAAGSVEAHGDGAVAEPIEAAAEAAPEAVAEPASAADEVPAVEPEAIEAIEVAEAVDSDAPAADADHPGPAALHAEDVDGRASAAAAQTNALLRRFRPGQSLDAELDAYERDQELRASARSVAAEAMPEPALDVPTATEPEPAPEPVAAAPEAPAHEPVAASQPEPAPIAATPDAPAGDEAAAADTPLDDVVAQPTWRIVAPDPGATPSTPVPSTPTPSPEPPGPPAAATAEPQWPAQPQWPTHRPSGVGLPFLDRPAQPTGGLEALWAESAREVTAAPTPVTLGGTPARPAAGGVQPCVSCGLSLSATARFCRRCGTRQG